MRAQKLVYKNKGYGRCSGGCPSTTAEPKYRLSLIGTDGTATAEFVLFGKVARQVIGKPVVSLIRSATKNQISPGNGAEHIVPEIAALVSQKFTFSVSVTQKSLSQRNVSFQVNGIVAFYGKQSCIPQSVQSAGALTTQADPTASKQLIQQSTDAHENVQKKARLSHMVAIRTKETKEPESANNNEDDRRADVLAPADETGTSEQKTNTPLSCVAHHVETNETEQIIVPASSNSVPEKSSSKSHADGKQKPGTSSQKKTAP